MQSLLFETPPASPAIYLSISALLTAVAALACWIPDSTPKPIGNTTQ